MKKILLVIAIFQLIACRKDKESPVDLLIGNGSALWELQQVLEGGADISSRIHPCLFDNLYHFKTAGAVEIWEGKSKCYPANPDLLKTAHWYIADKEQEKVFIDGTIYTIIYLEPGKMRLSHTNTGALTELVYHVR